MTSYYRVDSKAIVASIPIGIFKQNVIWARGDAAQCISLMRQKKSHLLDELAKVNKDDYDAVTLNGLPVVIYQPTTTYNLGLLAHELVHAASFVMKFAGCKFDEELLAYLVGYMFSGFESCCCGKHINL